MKNNLILFLKGALMGICDMIPGVSGGTIAFITGIYNRLINAVKSFSPELVIDFFKYISKRNEEKSTKLKQDIKNLDLVFLIPLAVGIATSVIIGSRIITYLLDQYFALTMAFFIGLIIASCEVIYKNIKNHHLNNILVGTIGLTTGIVISFLIPLKISDPSLLYVFIGGFLAISAMFLPGISGAFLLLILGIYEFMLGVIKHVSDNISYFLTFMVGAVLGALGISRLISYLFKKDRCKTLYVLLGLIIGSLSIPIKRVLTSNTTWNAQNIAGIILLFLIGFFTGYILEKKSKMETKC
jgi:putative membrane protein